MVSGGVAGVSFSRPQCQKSRGLEDETPATRREKCRARRDVDEPEASATGWDGKGPSLTLPARQESKSLGDVERCTSRVRRDGLFP